MLKRIALIALTSIATSTPAAFSSEPTTIDFKTSLGVIRVQLDEEKAPISSENFLKYVRSGFYDGTVFHRIISDFMIQGGGFAKEEDGIHQKEPLAPIKNEARNGLKNLRGTIAMARANDPHSSTSQFFINVKDNPTLDHPSFDGWGYAVFGRVVAGMEVVDRIRTQKTTIKKLSTRLPNGALYPIDFRDVPVEDVVIESVSEVKDALKKPQQSTNSQPPSSAIDGAGTTNSSEEE